MTVYYEAKYKKWRDAVHKGVLVAIDKIQKESTRRLNMSQTEEDDDTMFQEVEISWVSRPYGFSRFDFGFEDPRSEQIEYGGEFEENGQVVQKEPRPFFNNTIRDFQHGDQLANVIINTVKTEMGGE